MAPDLNSVPPSPRPHATPSNPASSSSSRRQSQPMGPPPIPLSSPGPAPATALQNAAASSAMSVSYARGDNTGVGTGPGPLRHPRPLTAAELHLQLEKEQEAVVNRLTRELSLLRAQQSASVASTTSSTSTGLPDPTDIGGNTHLLSGPNHPAPSQRRHHRSSSSTSTRSMTTTATTASGLSGSTAGWTTAGVAGSVMSGPGIHSNAIAPPRVSNERARDSLSRQNSITSSRRSGASSPVLPVAQSPHQHGEHFPSYYHHHRHSHSHSSHHPAAPSASSAPPVLGPERATSPPSTGVVSARFEETAYHRAELEVVKRENEALRRRVRDLERVVNARRQSMSERGRSTSGSTSASLAARADGPSEVGRARGRGSERDGDDESVRVGESAGSVGLGGGH